MLQRCIPPGAIAFGLVQVQAPLPFIKRTQTDIVISAFASQAMQPNELLQMFDSVYPPPPASVLKLSMQVPPSIVASQRIWAEAWVGVRRAAANTTARRRRGRFV